MIETLLLAALVAQAAVLLWQQHREDRQPPVVAPEPVEQPQMDRLLLERLRERFIVTAESGESFDGLLVEADERTVVLQNVSVLKADGAAMPVDGEVILRRDAVAYMQRP